MPLPEYFSTLQRTELDDLSQELHRDSLNREQIEKYREDGVLIVEEVFGDEHIAAAIEACERLESVAKDDDRSYADINLEAAGGGWEGQSGEKASHAGKIRKVKNLIDHGDEFKQMFLYPRLLQIITSLLGAGFRLHSKGFLMNKPAEVSTEKPWHQDGAYFPGDKEIITVWIPLQNVDETNGCLYGIPGSHMLGAMTHIGAEAQIDTSTLDLKKAASYPMKSGAVILMDKYTAHYSGINQTQAQRRALIFRYERTVQSDEQLQGYFDAERMQNRGIIESHLQILRMVRQKLEESGVGPDAHMLGDLYRESQEVRRLIGRLLSGPSVELGGGISPELRSGEQTSMIEKRHLIINRVLRDQAKGSGTEFLDMGTDYFYPFYTDYKPTQEALAALKTHTDDAMHYPSSYGLEGLRQAFQGFMQNQFGVPLDRDKEIMINTGASQAFDALSRAFDGRYVLLPSLSLPTVSVVARGNGAELLRLPVNARNGLIDLAGAQQEIDRLSKPRIRFMYLNSSANPSGHVASLEYLQQVVDFAKRNNILVLHDMDSWFTHHAETGRLHNILEADGARDCCISVLSLSKEFGLSGIRVGLIAGNSNVINAIRVHNSTFAVMIPEICQHAAQAALEAFGREDEKDKINTYITGVMRKTTEGWQKLGWPADGIHPPVGGFKYLISVPPNIQSQGEFSAVELFDFYIASRAYVKLSTSRSFNPSDDRSIRMVLMQNEEQIDEVFKRMQSIGVGYQMDLPPGLDAEYAAFLSQHASNDF